MTIQQRAAEILMKVQSAAGTRSVKMIGVTKTVRTDRIAEAYEAGIRIFGENRLQEALPKMAALAGLGAEWHFIGHLQTNKAKEAVRNFEWIHSVDSVKLMLQLEKEAEKLNKTVNFLFEVNLGNEESKHGFSESDLLKGLEASKDLNWCKARGLMIIPPFEEDPETTRPYFRKLKEMAESYRNDYPQILELSMGMSHDYEIAIEEGATMVRLGTALFGSRS